MTAAEVNARERVRLNIRRLLSERDITGRAFGKRLGHGDQWASNLLNGKFALSLDDLDTVAVFLRVAPSALVAAHDEQATFLSPTERRVVAALRALPPAVRDHMALLAEYLIGVTPPEVGLLQRIRRLEPDELRRIEHWIDVTLLAQGSARAESAPADLTPGVDALGAKVRSIQRQRRGKAGAMRRGESDVSSARPTSPRKE